MSKMYIEVIHNGNGEQRFPQRCIEVECPDGDVDGMQARIQGILDQWRRQQEEMPDSDMLDQFGDGKPDLSMDEVLAILPDDIKATAIDVPIRGVFI